MPKLNDTQLILLSTASQREDGSLYPLPETLTAGTSVTRAIAALLDKSLAEERETSVASAIRRSDGDISYGVFATTAGLALLGLDGNKFDDGAMTAMAAQPTFPKATKSGAVLSLLTREDGATLSEIIAATDWLPHTTRAALTGLRKKGHAIERSKRGTETCYRIAAA